MSEPVHYALSNNIENGPRLACRETYVPETRWSRALDCVSCLKCVEAANGHAGLPGTDGTRVVTRPEVTGTAEAPKDSVNRPSHYTGGAVEWRPIPGFEGLYSVSSVGDILSHKTNRVRAKCAWDRGRYLNINLYKNGIASKPLHVHRLVAEAFLPRPSDEHVVNHLNGDKQDNRVENLQWVTCSENIQHAYDTGLMSWELKTAESLNELNPRERRAIRELSKRGISCETLAEVFFTTLEVVDDVL